MVFSERKRRSIKDQVRNTARVKAFRKAHQRDEKSFTTANLCQNCRNRDTFSAKPEQKEGREQSEVGRCAQRTKGPEARARQANERLQEAEEAPKTGGMRRAKDRKRPLFEKRKLAMAAEAE